MSELKITMLGSFGVQWSEGGAERDISLSGNSCPKFMRLLEMVWLAGDTGVSKDKLIQDLYEGKELAKPINSLNNLILQARRHLVQAGLPKAEYIINRGQICAEDPAVMVFCDAQEFHELIKKAREAGVKEAAKDEKSVENDPEDQAAFYAAAVDLYKGRLLPSQSSQPWVQGKAQILTEEYREAIGYLAKKALRSRNNAVLSALYRKAIHADPEGNWGDLSAKWLKNLESTDVRNESDDIIGRFLKTDEYIVFADRVRVGGTELIRIPFRISNGPCLCSWESFIDVASVTRENMERTGTSVFLMMIDNLSGSLSDEQEQEAWMRRLQQSIQENLRAGDALTRYGNSAYIILMVGYEEEDRKHVLWRIQMDMRRYRGQETVLRGRGIIFA